MSLDAGRKQHRAFMKAVSNALPFPKNVLSKYFSPVLLTVNPVTDYFSNQIPFFSLGMSVFYHRITFKQSKNREPIKYLHHFLSAYDNCLKSIKRSKWNKIDVNIKSFPTGAANIGLGII